MKRLITAGIALAIAFINLVTATFAWAVTENKGSYKSASVKAGLPEATNYIMIAQSSGDEGEHAFTSSLASKTGMQPVTLASDGTFQWQDGNRLTYTEEARNIYTETVYISSEVFYNQISIESITFSGTGATSPITDAIRVRLTSGGEELIASKNSHPGFMRLTTKGTPREVKIEIWFEGTDATCTYENIETAGALSVTITLAGAAQ